jgi:FkbM family methyltransferase
MTGPEKAKPAPGCDDVAIVNDVLETLAQLPDRHATHDPLWRLWRQASREPLRQMFGSIEAWPVPFGPFGELIFPFIEMGSITSIDLFGLDELILFSFYNANRKRYRRAVDFGANIGLHTTIMARCGFEVRSFEPDPHHFKWLNGTLTANKVTSDVREAAISTDAGHLEFVRVLGNTTGRHLAGAKASPYGELERFSVNVEAAAPHLAWADLAKIDIEGHEAVLITGLPVDTWRTTDAVLEVGTADNAAKIFAHLRGSKINMFSQKAGWQKVTSLADMPTSHRDGSLFISGKARMFWRAEPRR